MQFLIKPLSVAVKVRSFLLKKTMQSTHSINWRLSKFLATEAFVDPYRSYTLFSFSRANKRKFFPVKIRYPEGNGEQMPPSAVLSKVCGAEGRGRKHGRKEPLRLVQPPNINKQRRYMQHKSPLSST